MNRKEYIAALEKQLLRLPKTDRDEVLNDFETHFDNETASGLTEEEISAQLGDPAELAATYLENLPEGSKGEQAHIEQTLSQPEQPTYLGKTADGRSYYSVPQRPLSTTTAQQSKVNSENIVIFIIVCIFAVVPLASAIVGILIGIIGVIAGCFSGAAALVALGAVSTGVSVSGGIGLILIGAAVLMLAAFLITGMVAAIKGIIWLVKWFIGWSKSFLAAENK